jgi:hypothetical protein
MYKAISLVLLISGIALLIVGITAMDSIASGFSTFFTGSPTDRSMWLVLGGVVLIAISGFGLFRGSRSDA